MAQASVEKLEHTGPAEKERVAIINDLQMRESYEVIINDAQMPVHLVRSDEGARSDFF